MRAILVSIILLLLLAACETETDTDPTATNDTSPSPAATQQQSQAATAVTPEPATATVAATATSEPTATATATPEPTNTPAPTSTPEPTATPQPTATPTPVPPTPTATPAPQPIAYSGSGDDVISIEKPGGPDSVAIAYIRGNAAGNHFAVTSYGDGGEYVDLLVNTTDPYEGIVLLDIRQGERTTLLEITATGEWHVEVRPLAAARRVSIPGAVEGMGDDVLIVDGTPSTAHITGNAGASHFAVIAYGDRSHLLVNTTDPYEGRVIIASDVVLVQVDAEGGWQVTFE
ncbi:MAG TPA: hypothetical protein VMM78_06660 [Thermomicrobiales bacterium]|nr:hypothetical protein [Thermomicrobiales bacterium]